MKIAVTSYTGEYAAALHKAIGDAGCWVRELDKGMFEDGFDAGRQQVSKGGSDASLEDAWLAYLHRQVGQGYATTGELDNVSVMLLLNPTEDQLIAITESYANVLKADAIGEYCGDDQHFDYFPDGMEMLLQLCRVWEDQGGIAFWQAVRTFAWKSHWEADGEWNNIDEWLSAR